MSLRVAINGFGRIGRNVLRASVEANGKAGEQERRCGREPGGKMPTRGSRRIIAVFAALGLMGAGALAPARADEAYQADPRLVAAAQRSRWLPWLRQRCQQES